tara:strand:- start:7928 stop:8155 length:228 start_codon:yes stop_codon:yes gene_type:complete
MGGIFKAPKAPPPPPPPDPELGRQRREAERQAAEEKKKQEDLEREEKAQLKRGRRGYKSLLSGDELGFPKGNLGG